MNDNKDHLEDQNLDKKAQQESAEDMIARELNVDDSMPGTQHLNDQVEENTETDRSQAELAEMKDKYLRLMAEFDNVKRRNAKEKEELRQTAGKDLMQSLLVVVDDMDRASRQMETSTDVEKIKEGVTLVFNKLRHTLQQKGLKKMESLHTDFDADLHEAITEIPAGDETMVGKVMDEIEPGYYLNDKLIRFAKVVVGK
ncbi:MAG TPA: nucleotide exchange factor GrpE [Flavipsychrobacter sp.]|nr:nucleotide exchange factor GrpE [Flavipsychrobacter sp.]